MSLDALNTLSPSRKISVLGVLCFALFLDTFNNSSLFAAIPPIARQLNLLNSESVWLLSAYQLTFASLLLVTGRVSDLFDPKWVFITGSTVMAIFALVCGFVRSKVVLILFRAFMGAGGALTIPSAQHLIVHLYPDPANQAKALTVFGAMGAIGTVIGLIIGALFVSFVSWPWVFYFSSIVSTCITTSIIILVPNTKRSKESGSRMILLKRLDLVGVGAMTLALILFIFGVTSGSIDGWESAKVITPLIISVLLAVAFFFWESKLPETYAALPPKMWRYENFAILIIISLVPFMWWGAVFPVFSWLWETVYGWSAINVALHFLPIALGIFPIVPLAAGLQSKLRIKWVVFIGFVLLEAGSCLLPFADSEAHYWRFAFPGFLLGTAGAALIFATSNIALLAITPPEVSGIVSAVFTSVLQMGAALGVSIVTSIQTSVQVTHGGPSSFSGRAAGLWFLLAWTGIIWLCFTIFMKNTIGPIGHARISERQELDKGDGLEEKTIVG